MKQETAVATTDIEPETANHNNFRPAPERKRTRGLSEDRRFKIFAGSANRQLAEEICKQIGVPLGETKIQRFADGEIYFQLLENVRGVDVFIVQPTLQSGGPESGGTADHDRRPQARLRRSHHYGGAVLRLCPAGPQGPVRVFAISSKLVADLLTTAGTNRALFMDLHAAQIQGFFNIPVDHLFASPVMVGYFREKNLPNLTVVSPDAGGVERAPLLLRPRWAHRSPSWTSAVPTSTSPRS